MKGPARLLLAAFAAPVLVVAGASTAWAVDGVVVTGPTEAVAGSTITIQATYTATNVDPGLLPLGLNLSLNDADPNLSSIAATSFPSTVTNCASDLNGLGYPRVRCDWDASDSPVTVTYTIQVGSQAADEVWAARGLITVQGGPGLPGSDNVGIDISIVDPASTAPPTTTPATEPTSGSGSGGGTGAGTDAPVPTAVPAGADPSSSGAPLGLLGAGAVVVAAGAAGYLGLRRRAGAHA